MTGWCHHCRQPVTGARYRLWRVGLRWLCAPCAERLAAMGMRLESVTDGEPRRMTRRLTGAGATGAIR